MAIVQFVKNHSDLSSESGFQFEFYCDRCGTGYQTRFTPVAGMQLTDILDAAGNLFGGVFSTAASVGARMQSVGWEKAKEQAFRAAVEEVAPYFNQCRHCGRWVDKPCWDTHKALCKECRDEADAAAEEEKASSGKPSKKSKSAAGVYCQRCQADVQGAKFCPDCGTPVQRKTRCAECGSSVENTRFCPSCGAQQS